MSVSHMNFPSIVSISILGLALALVFRCSGGIPLARLESEYLGNNEIKTIAGSGQSLEGVGGLGTFATFRTPFGLAYDNEQIYMYITDQSSKSMYRMDTSSQLVEAIKTPGISLCFLYILTRAFLNFASAFLNKNRCRQFPGTISIGS